MQLSEQQVNFFDVFGYLYFPGLFANDIDLITKSFEEIWADHNSSNQGKVHDGSIRSTIVPFIDQNEYLCSLIDDQRIDTIPTTILGNDYNYVASDGNYYVGDTPWHSDFSRPKTTIKVAFYLDEVTKDTGCLRVIPGSHKMGDTFATLLKETIVTEDPKTKLPLGIKPNEVPAVNLECKPGDLVCFDRRIKHASFGGGTHRRMFTMIFEPRYPDDELEALRSIIGLNEGFLAKRAYGDIMINTASPERMVHLEQRLANDSHLKNRSKKV